MIEHFKRYRTHWLIFLVGIAISFWIFNGFGSSIQKISHCSAVHKKWVNAEYFETSTSIDFDGNLSTQTDFWDEPASETWEVTTLNGVLQSESLPGLSKIDSFGIYRVSKYPPHDLSMKHDFDFDRFSFQEVLAVKVHTSADYFSTNADKYLSCVEKIGQIIMVKTWYGNAYSSDYL